MGRRFYVVCFLFSLLVRFTANAFSLVQNEKPTRCLDILYGSKGYDETDRASQGLVSSLTALVNSISRRPSSNFTRMMADDDEDDTAKNSNAPTTPQELLRRIEQDYTERNYLWTGDIDLACFDPDCCFTDPTLTFNGTDTFVRNLQNLRPIVDSITTDCRSDLISIKLHQDNDAFVETRWNMVGTLGRLPWKPRIDVMGRTKFWFRHDPYYRVVRYDEAWEIPAWKALLQLVTPGTPLPDDDTSRRNATKDGS